MNILISVNKSYLTAAFVMLASLRRYNNENIDVYFLNSSLDNISLEKFNKKLSKLKDMSIHIINTSKINISELPISKQFSVEVYNRILAQFLLPKDIDRVLWLDADIVIKKNLYSFYHQSFDDKWIVACADKACNTKWISNIKQKVGIKEGHVYFNSGVLLINLNELRKNTSIEQILDTSFFLKEKITFPDQDILNYLYQGKTKYTDESKYNCQARKNDNTAIVHFVGQRKPWNCVTRFSRYWWEEALKLKGTFLLFIWYCLKNCFTTPLHITRKVLKKILK